MFPLTLLTTLLALLGPAPAAPPPTSTTPRPVAVVELFTSQGCSSCPAADAVLADLQRDAAAGKLDVVPLSFHVDYWNYLGWADPFSDPWYSARQRDYTDRLGVRTYTPQAVINGRTELIGSRRREVYAAVSRALDGPAPDLAIAYERTDSERRIQLDYRITGGAAGAEARVVAVAAQPHARSSVNRGENRGRELSHVNVVRTLRTVDFSPTGTISLQLPEELDPAEALVVLLVQESEGGPILAAVH